ncbi:MAG TPA: hypothetical protein VIQ98_07165 [Gemmatimonadales bacterium]
MTLGPALDPERLRRAVTGGQPGPVAGHPAPARILGLGEIDVPAAAIHQPSPGIRRHCSWRASKAGW